MSILVRAELDTSFISANESYLCCCSQSPAKKNYVVVFMKVADTDKRVAPAGEVTDMQHEIMHVRTRPPAFFFIIIYA